MPAVVPRRRAAAAATRSGARAVAARVMTPRVGRAMITRALARALAVWVLARAKVAWAGARAVTLWSGGAAAAVIRAMVITGAGGPRPRRVRTISGIVGLHAGLAVADRAPGGLGRLLLGFFLGPAFPRAVHASADPHLRMEGFLVIRT